MKFTVVCPKNLEKVQKYSCAMDRSLKERIQFLPSPETAAVSTPAEADLLIVFGEKDPVGDNSICGFDAGDTADLKAKITVACGEDITGDIRCGLGSDCDLTFSSLQKNRLQICLLHPVRCLNGHLCEPFEFAFRGSVGNAYPLLAAAAIKILCSVRETGYHLQTTTVRRTQRRKLPE